MARRTDRPDIESRLRALGKGPLDPALRARHLDRLADVGPARRRPTGFTVAAALATVLLAGVTLAALPGTDDGTVRTAATTAAAQGPSGAADADPASLSAADLFDQHPCAGPPPFAGTPPEGATEAEREANRSAEAEAFAAERAANCPDDDTSGPPGGAGPRHQPGADPFPDDPCLGPPPFAGTPPEGATEAEREANRSAEAEAFAAERAANCPDDDTSGPPGGVPPFDVADPDGAPPVDAPPLEPTSTPPVDAPPLEPTSTPPVDAPPLEPADAPPVDTGAVAPPPAAPVPTERVPEG